MLDEDIFNMEYASGKFPTAGIPIGAVITVEDKKWKGPILGIAPSFAVLDPSYTAFKTRTS